MLKELLGYNNVGTFERGVRVGAGAVALLWGITGGGLLLVLLGAIGAATGHYGSCPVYKQLGRNTNTGG